MSIVIHWPRIRRNSRLLGSGVILLQITTEVLRRELLKSQQIANQQKDGLNEILGFLRSEVRMQGVDANAFIVILALLSSVVCYPTPSDEQQANLQHTTRQIR